MRAAPGRDDLAQAVAVNLFRLMAIKDEYEVARLYTDGSFAKQLRREFASWGKLEFHLAPPLLAARGPGHRPPGQGEIRAVDDARLPAARGRAGAPRHVRSTRSATRPTGGWSDASSPTTRRRCR